MVGAIFPRNVNRNPPDLPLKLQMREKKRKGIRGGGTSLRSVVGTADTLRSLRSLTLRFASGPLLHSLRSLAPPTLRVVGVPLEPSLREWHQLPVGLPAVGARSL